MEPDLERCRSCGHVLGSGLFCTECGRPTGDLEDWRTGTAERPAVGPAPPIADEPALPAAPPAPPVPPAPPAPPAPTLARLPPPAVAPPPPARYPLFADEAPAASAEPVTADSDAGLLVPGLADPDPVPEPAPAPAAVPGRAAREPRRGGPSLLPWLVGLAALVLVAMLGTLLLLPDPDEDDVAVERATADSTGDAAPEPSVPGSPGSPGSSAPTPAEPSPTRAPDGDPAPVTRAISATVPATAPANQDVDGNQVRYEARNMLDDVPATCWRMPGSGAGQEIVLELAAPTVVSEVGLINGYAKTSGEFDWYRGNRRLLAVEWVFDDGTAVPQQLTQTRALQTVSVPDVETATIRLRMLEVSAPGRGRSARDFTAISDLSVVGVERG